jgi:hypothetical protein
LVLKVQLDVLKLVLVETQDLKVKVIQDQQEEVVEVQQDLLVAL